ncbi:hypothetical protein BOTNAR_0034g00240 [Botryotinia narcissicola]|uniref:Uncharacterized protein n=1 Tax=Botryotinia narcissicola TaxID=278944 RepID=A0A4Z1J3X1_9HELO|nr:hypothetical protein BOTNAR_0034g00240 [Botryotinia narcissicola]
MTFFGSTISKVVASVATLQNETTFALSSLNLGFTLIKLEAPIEYKGARESIFSARKHKTARNLGALFDDRAPLAPEYPIMFEEDYLVVADNWDEILTLNESSLSVSDSHGKLAREVSSYCVNVQTQRSTILVSKNLCWACLKEHSQGKGFGAGHEKVLIAPVISAGFVFSGFAFKIADSMLSLRCQDRKV